MRFRQVNRFLLTIILGTSFFSAIANGGGTSVKKRSARAKTSRPVIKAPTITGVKKTVVAKADAASLAILAMYDSLHLDELGLNQKVFKMALKGMEKLRRMGKLTNDRILSIVDFSQSSVQKRMYVIDVENCTLLYNTLVAHGMKSGKEKAISFSNKPSSNKSSLGFYVTNSTYMGSNGYSLRLQGCEKGFNDNAAKRAIVVHGADYVNEEWIPMQGYIGRSQGCPALPPELSKPMIDEIKDGSCLFIYHPNAVYLAKSQLVK